MTEADILFRIKLQTLQTKLSQKVTENEGKVTNADIGDYYDKNKKRFAQPERRSLSVVVTKTKSKAKQARARLAAGKSFKVVAKRFSIDDASKRQGGKLPSLAKGQQDRTLDKAVFGAKKGVLVGPVKTQFGWYVFKVTKVTPASQQSLSQARETIRNVLRQERQQKALDHFVKNFRSDYKDKTTCAKGFQIAECKNGPKRASTGPASGGAPQGGSPAGPQGTPQPTPTPAPQTPPGR
jgi:foldase protein PrsA